MSLAFKTSEFTTSQKNTTEDKIIDIKLECKLSRSCNWDPPAIIAEKNNANNIVGVAFDADGNFEVEDFIGKNGEMKERSIPKKENGEIKEISSYDQNGKLERITK